MDILEGIGINIFSIILLSLFVFIIYFIYSYYVLYYITIFSQNPTIKAILNNNRININNYLQIFLYYYNSLK